MTHTNYTMFDSCPVCKSSDVAPFFEMPQALIHCNVLWPSEAEAINAARGDIHLGFCGSCGHVYNYAFRPELMEYSCQYENSLHFSPRFQDYARSLAENLIRNHRLYGKHVVEIGCGKGEFLALLCQLGNNRGTGFDPSYDDGRIDQVPGDQITIIRDFYSERYAMCEADLIVCRQVLEHLRLPHDFLLRLRHALNKRPDTTVFFEVPNAMFSLKDHSIWDLIYEHYSYFTMSSLAEVFLSSGFQVRDLCDGYEGQFLLLEALPAADSSWNGNNPWRDVQAIRNYVEPFAANYRKLVDAWRNKLSAMASSGLKVAAWGAGSKGTMFLNLVSDQARIEYMVDINPHKQGMYVAGTGQRIVPPSFLIDYRPDTIIVMNPIYVEEISQMITNLGLSPELMPVGNSF